MITILLRCAERTLFFWKSFFNFSLSPAQKHLLHWQNATTLTQTYIMLRECYHPAHTNLYNTDRMLSLSCKHISLWQKPTCITRSCTPIPWWKNTFTTTKTYNCFCDNILPPIYTEILVYHFFSECKYKYMLKQAHCTMAECYYTPRNILLQLYSHNIVKLCQNGTSRSHKLFPTKSIVTV